MIGQTKLLNSINNLISKYPRFSIIVGGRGSGKKTICKEIASKLNLSPLFIGNKIEDIRNAIDMAYTQFKPIVFIIADADNMSLAAKNSMLKITEEPPKESYFILTLENIENTLPTIKSRGTVFKLDPYSQEELVEYRKLKGYNSVFDDIIKLVCLTTGDVDKLFAYDVEEFYSFVKIVADNIQVPKSGNAFKISQKLKIKDTDKGYDLSLFLKAIEEVFLMKAKETKNKCYLLASLESAKSLRDLRYATVSKLGIIDKWIMNTRAVLRDV